MTEQDLKALEKRTRKLKRIASEWAAKLHDLVEDRLPAAYTDLPEIADATYKACQEWERANTELQQAKELEASI